MEQETEEERRRQEGIPTFQSPPWHPYSSRWSNPQRPGGHRSLALPWEAGEGVGERAEAGTGPGAIPGIEGNPGARAPYLQVEEAGSWSLVRVSTVAGA